MEALNCFQKVNHLKGQQLTLQSLLVLKPKDKNMLRNKAIIDQQLQRYPMQNSCYRQRDPSSDQCLSLLTELVLLNKRQKISLFPSRKTEDNSTFIFNHFNDLSDFNEFMSSSVDIPSGRDEEATDQFLIAEQKETKESKKSRSSAKQGKYSNLSFSISLVCCFC